MDCFPADKIVVGVLAGGRSRRFGRDKAAFEVNGRPLLHHLVRRIQRAGLRTIVVGRRRDRTVPDEVACLPDALPGHGPLSGLHALLSSLAPDERAFLLPCDLPFFQPELISQAVRHLFPDDQALLLRDAHGPQPTCGFYSPECLPILEDCLRRNDNIVWALLDRIPHRFLSLPEVLPGASQWLLFNLNSTEDEQLFWKLYPEHAHLFEMGD